MSFSHNGNIVYTVFENQTKSNIIITDWVNRKIVDKGCFQNDAEYQKDILKRVLHVLENIRSLVDSLHTLSTKDKLTDKQASLIKVPSTCKNEGLWLLTKIVGSCFEGMRLARDPPEPENIIMFVRIEIDTENKHLIQVTHFFVNQQKNALVYTSPIKESIDIVKNLLT